MPNPVYTNIYSKYKICKWIICSNHVSKSHLLEHSQKDSRSANTIFICTLLNCFKCSYLKLMIISNIIYSSHS